MRVVLRAVHHVFERVGSSLCRRDGVSHLVGHFGRIVVERHDSLVDTLPVVHILTPSPHLLERSLTLADGRRVVEVPFARLVSGVVGHVVGVVHVAHSALLRHLLLRVKLSLCVAFFLLFLLQSLYHAVDGLVSFFLRHLCQGLERVLQVYGVGVWH